MARAIISDRIMYIFYETRYNCCMRKIEESWLLHKRLGHVNFDKLVKIRNIGAIRGLQRLAKPESTTCKSCKLGKQTRVHFKSKEFTTIRPLETVHADLCGPTRKKSRRGEKYFILFVDNFTRATSIMLMKEKLEAFNKFKYFKALVQNEIHLKIKCLRTDRGGEFKSKLFDGFCDEHGITRQYSIARTPQQNGVVKRTNRLVQDMARAMLDEDGVSDTLWGKVAQTTVYLANRVLLRPNTIKTPYELWKGRPKKFD